MVTCAIVTQLPSGETTIRTWYLHEHRAEEIAGWLGDPDAEQYLTAEQADAATTIADEAVTVHHR